MFRGESRTAGTSKMEHFVIIDNTIITKSSILDVTTALDPLLDFIEFSCLYSSTGLYLYL